MRERFFQKKNSGFTLVETLAAVAILVVLLGISAVAVLRLQKYLEITRLDNAARGIYMAAQNRAVLLSGGKQLKALVQGEDNAVSLAARTGEEAPLYYVAHTAEKTDPALEQLLTAGSIDPALRQGVLHRLRAGKRQRHRCLLCGKGDGEAGGGGFFRLLPDVERRPPAGADEGRPHAGALQRRRRPGGGH